MNSYLVSDVNHIRSEGQAWRFTGEKVLITGATGFLGSWLAEVFDHQCELTQARDFIDGEYDTIFHFAPTPIDLVVECAKKTGAVVAYASSGAVYGGIPKQVDEDAPTNPKTAYGMEKLRSEKVLEKSGLEYYNFRLFALAGAGLRNYFALTHFIEAVKTGKPIEVFGNGKQIRSYLYIADVLAWMLKIMEYGRPGAYNVGSERAISIGGLADAVVEYVHGHPVKYVKPYFVEPAPYYLPDTTKARACGCNQRFDLDYSIKRMME